MSAALTRRAIIGALPVALALPAAASAAVVASPDATLLALGRRFEMLLPRFDVAVAEQHRLHDIWESACLARGPLVWGDKVACDRVADEVGYTLAVCDCMNHFCGRLVRLSARIRRLEPQTLAGLAVWARAALFESDDYKPRWESLNDADDGERQIHDLVAQIERMAVQP